MRLAVALGWHSLAFEELLDLVRRAESAGLEAAFADGDVSQFASGRDADVLDGWTCRWQISPACLMTRRGTQSTPSRQERPSLTRIPGEPTFFWIAGSRARPADPHCWR